MKRAIVVLLMVIIAISCTACVERNNEISDESNNENYTITYESGEFDDKNWNDTVGTYCSDVIPDEDTALKVAQAIFDGIEKNKIEQEYVPYSVFYDEQDEIWIISFGENLDEFSDEIIVGGGCDIAMQKKDGKVLRIWFGE